MAPQGFETHLHLGECKFAPWPLHRRQRPKAQRLFERWMLKGKSRGPQRELLAGFVDRAAVALVAVERAADGCQLHADLMRPPGVQLDLDQAEPVLAAEQLIVQHSLLGVLLAFSDHADGIRPRVLPKKVAQRSGRLWRLAMHDSDVRLVELPRSYRVR